MANKSTYSICIDFIHLFICHYVFICKYMLCLYLSVSPAPSCPDNSHYTTCINACSPTCTHLHGPPHCSDNEACVQGCACDDGYVLKQRVCVPIQQCGCVDRDGSKYRVSNISGWLFNNSTSYIKSWFPKTWRLKHYCLKVVHVDIEVQAV